MKVSYVFPIIAVVALSAGVLVDPADSTTKSKIASTQNYVAMAAYNVAGVRKPDVTTIHDRYGRD